MSNPSAQERARNKPNSSRQPRARDGTARIEVVRRSHLLPAYSKIAPVAVAGVEQPEDPEPAAARRAL
jgi:hypothetical protein